MNYKQLFGSLLVLSLFILSPVTLASAQDKASFWADGAAGAAISADGLVRVFGATITAVSGNVVNASVTLGSQILNWIVNVNADTKVFADGERTTSTTGLTVGEKIAFSGTATATSGPAIVVSAKKVVDSSWKNFKKVAGEVTAVNSANGTYTVNTRGDTDVTVQTNANTEWKVGTTTGAFGSVQVGSWINALGTLSADASVLTASHITLRMNEIPQHVRELKEHWKELREEWKEAKKEWREERKESRDDDRGLHLGTHLKGFLGIGLGNN